MPDTVLNKMDKMSVLMELRFLMKIKVEVGIAQLPAVPEFNHVGGEPALNQTESQVNPLLSRVSTPK